MLFVFRGANSSATSGHGVGELDPRRSRRQIVAGRLTGERFIAFSRKGIDEAQRKRVRAVDKRRARRDQLVRKGPERRIA